MSPTYSWLCGVIVMTPDWELVGCEFKYRDLCFWKEWPSLISLISIQNRKNSIEIIKLHAESGEIIEGIFIFQFYARTNLNLHLWRKCSDSSSAFQTHMMDPVGEEASAPSKFQEAMRKLLKHIPEEHLVHFHPTKVNIFLKKKLEVINPLVGSQTPPVWDFWWLLLWVSKSERIPPLHASSPIYNGLLRFT